MVTVITALPCSDSGNDQQLVTFVGINLNCRSGVGCSDACVVRNARPLSAVVEAIEQSALSCVSIQVSPIPSTDSRPRCSTSSHLGRDWTAHRGSEQGSDQAGDQRQHRSQLHALSRKSLNHFLPFHWAFPAWAGMRARSACSSFTHCVSPVASRVCAVSLADGALSFHAVELVPALPRVHGRGLVGDLRRPRPHIVRPRSRYSTS